jgi:hypothetical protein
MSIVKLNNRAVKDATAVGSITGLGNLVFISRSTASSSSSLSITSGINSTHKEYIFIFNNIHPSAQATNFTFNLSSDSGSNYNIAKTTTNFQAYHKPTNDSDYGFGYSSGNDLAQGTGSQILAQNVSNDDDGSMSGFLHLFEPSSSVFVKHFISTVSYEQKSGGGAVYQVNDYIAGYGNTTSAIDAIQFSMSSGNIDSGTIDMYGVL